jgi:hypothetical protein
MHRVYIWLFSALLVWGVLAQVSVSHLSVEARLARQTTAQALKDATLAASAAASAQHEASTARIERDSAIARAALQTAHSARLRTSYHVAVVSAPDTCRSVVVLADSALAAADGVTVQLRAALSASQNGERALQTAVDTLLPALQHLRSASSTLVRTVNTQAHRSLMSKLLPHLGAGIAVGVDGVGAPHLITGITLGWSF